MSNLVFVRFVPKPGCDEEVREILRNMVTNSRTEPGCLLYDLYDCNLLEDGRHVYCLTETYADGAALQAHRETDYYKDYRAKIVDLIDEPITPHILNEIDVVGKLR